MFLNNKRNSSVLHKALLEHGEIKRLFRNLVHVSSYLNSPFFNSLNSNISQILSLSIRSCSSKRMKLYLVSLNSNASLDFLVGQLERHKLGVHVKYDIVWRVLIYALLKSMSEKELGAFTARYVSYITDVKARNTVYQQAALHGFYHPSNITDITTDGVHVALSSRNLLHVDMVPKIRYMKPYEPGECEDKGYSSNESLEDGEINVSNVFRKPNTWWW